MFRRIAMVLLGIGAVVGIGSGIRALRWHGAGCGLCQHSAARRSGFEDRVAEVCARAADRVYRERNSAAPRPREP